MSGAYTDRTVFGLPVFVQLCGILVNFTYVKFNLRDSGFVSKSALFIWNRVLWTLVTYTKHAAPVRQANALDRLTLHLGDSQRWLGVPWAGHHT